MEQYQGDWCAFFTTVENKPSSITVDLGLSKIAPVLNKTHLLSIEVDIKNPTKDGFISNEESKTIWEIEDKITYELNQAIFVGTLTLKGERIIYYYVDESYNYKDTLSKILNSSSYTYRDKLKEDPKWEAYFNFLHPTEYEYQQIMNQRVIANLEKEGDSLTKPRLVEHWINFKTSSDRAIFLDKIKDLSFKVENENFDKEYQDFPYSLHISREDKVDYQSVQEYCMLLWEVAKESNGYYDGWETSIEKD